MNLQHFGLIGAIGFAVLPAPAGAQSQFFKDSVTSTIRKVGVHVNMNFRDPVDPDVTKGRTFGVSIGLSPGRTNGWRYPVGLTMFDEDLHSPSGQEFAALRTTALMAGIGYGWHFGRLSTGATLQTGYAFNHGQANGDIQQAFAVPNGAVSLDVDNSTLLRPQVKAEYFITPKFTLRASADYMMMRPGIAVTTPAERFVDRWNASNVHASVGVGFYPMRK
jgi:hypothetical protein